MFSIYLGHYCIAKWGITQKIPSPAHDLDYISRLVLYLPLSISRNTSDIRCEMNMARSGVKLQANVHVQLTLCNVHEEKWQYGQFQLIHDKAFKIVTQPKWT